MVVKIHLYLLFFISVSVLAANKVSAQDNLYLTFDNESDLTIEGEYRFIEVNGNRGFQPLSVHTKAFILTRIHKNTTGSLSIWACPMETLDFAYPVKTLRDEHSINYPLVSDHYPPRQITDSKFALYYNIKYPPLIARFIDGGFWGVVNKDYGPFVYAEILTMKKGHWYNITYTWNKEAGNLKMYVNGILVGYTNQAIHFARASDTLFIGNPGMVVHDLSITDQWMEEQTVRNIYYQQLPPDNQEIDRTIFLENTPKYQGRLSISLDSSWSRSYSCTFLEEGDLDDWIPQTGDLYRNDFDLRITEEGLLFDTPDTIGRESRMTLWNPEIFEGDIWIEYDFRLESEEGLAVVIMQASGMQGEDIINDYGMRNTGAMVPMLYEFRNYHWEYIRRVTLERPDVETQYVQKNPWNYKLFNEVIPRIEMYKWYTLQFVRINNRILGAINGNVVFDVRDNPERNAGPVINKGRPGIRQMYKTKITYRNYKVYTRNKTK